MSSPEPKKAGVEDMAEDTPSDGSEVPMDNQGGGQMTAADLEEMESLRVQLANGKKKLKEVTSVLKIVTELLKKSGIPLEEDQQRSVDKILEDAEAEAVREELALSLKLDDYKREIARLEEALVKTKEKSERLDRKIEKLDMEIELLVLLNAMENMVRELAAQ